MNQYAAVSPSGTSSALPLSYTPSETNIWNKSSPRILISSARRNQPLGLGIPAPHGSDGPSSSLISAPRRIALAPPEKQLSGVQPFIGEWELCILVCCPLTETKLLRRIASLNGAHA